MKVNRNNLFCTASFVAAIALTGASGLAASVTGNPAADGWAPAGNSLTSGTYVGGGANYDYNAYGTSMTVATGSTLALNTDWAVGDTVLAVGGVFTNTTANPPGWTVAGTPVNADLTASSGPKLQAKFGSSTATFSPSTVAPGAGNGLASLPGNGGTGAVQVRTTGYNTPSAWIAGSGILAAPTSGHFEQNQGPSNNDATVDSVLDAARLIWVADSSGQVVSWEILLDSSLLGRIDGGIATPSVGSSAIMTVQNGDGDFTNALVHIVQASNSPAVVPVPSAACMGLSLLGALGLASKVRSRKARS